jgi:hypothetical protein
MGRECGEWFLEGELGGDGVGCGAYLITQSGKCRGSGKRPRSPAFTALDTPTSVEVERLW